MMICPLSHRQCSRSLPVHNRQQQLPRSQVMKTMNRDATQDQLKHHHGSQQCVLQCRHVCSGLPMAFGLEIKHASVARTAVSA